MNNLIKNDTRHHFDGPLAEAAGHFVYIVRCKDGTFYTGYARDPKTRVNVHNAGKGARYTSSRRPVRLVYLEECETRGAALSREHAIKSLTRLEKRRLVKRGP